MLPYDDALSCQWAEITAHRQRLGQPILCGDAWIAATAVRHDLPLVTHNLSDYANILGLEVISHARPQ